MPVNASHAALEDAEIPFDRIGVRSTPDVFADRMLYRGRFRQGSRHQRQGFLADAGVCWQALAPSGGGGRECRV
jgi:hypothetical protein